MKTDRYTAALLFALLFLGSEPIGAREIYKYRMPDGSIAYSDKVLTKGKLQEIIVAPPPSSAQVEQALRLKRKREEESVNLSAAQRVKDLNSVDADIHSRTAALIEAKQNLASRLEPGPEERLGTVGGHTRLAPSYWERVQELELDVEDARERLDDAYAARNAIK